MSKAIIYVRVSTKEQLEGSSLEVQERMCREFALRNGYDEDVKVFVEKGESAKTADRTELKTLLEFVAKNHKEISAAIVHKIDRLARNSLDFAQLKLFFNRYGVKFLSATENLEDTPVGRLMETQLAGFAQFDNEIRAERSKNGQINAVKAGRYVWQAPVGYINTGGKGRTNLSHNKPEIVRLVRKAWELVDTGYTVEEARKELAKQGLELSKSYFHRLIRNKLYMGVIEKFGISIVGNFKYIVEPELFLRVQDKLNSMGKKMPIYRVDNPDFPLRNFIVCSFCEDGLTGSWSTGNGGKYAYYRCKHCKKINYDKDGDDGLETKFTDHLRRYHYKDELKGLMLKAIEANWEDRNKDNDNQKKDVEKQILRLKIENREIVGKNLKNVISDHLAKEMTSENEGKITNLELKLQDHQATLSDVMTVSERSLSVLEDISGTWKFVDLDIKKRFQNFLFPLRLPFDGRNFRTAQTAYCISQNVMSLPQKSSIVQMRGLEPPTLAGHGSEPCAYTNSATSAPMNFNIFEPKKFSGD